MTYEWKNTAPITRPSRRRWWQPPQDEWGLTRRELFRHRLDRRKLRLRMKVSTIKYRIRRLYRPHRIDWGGEWTVGPDWIAYTLERRRVEMVNAVFSPSSVIEWLKRNDDL